MIGKTVKIKTLSEAVSDTKKYITDRKEGKVLSYATKFKKLNKMTMNGFEANTIACISALSGFGKSTISKEIRDSLPEENIVKLCFNFEMLSMHQMTRSASTKRKMSLNKMYSLDNEISNHEVDLLFSYFDELVNRIGDDFLFVETMCTAKQIRRTAMNVYKEKCKGKAVDKNGQPTGEDKTLYVEVDHALLALPSKEGIGEKQKVDELMLEMLKFKKDISSDNGKMFCVILSQMNREIRSEKRMTNPDLHRPDTSCLFGASSIEFACDYIIFAHIPGRLGLKKYTEEGLPVSYLGQNQITGEDEPKYICYFELVKNRSGKPDQRFPLYNNLEIFSFEEMPIKTLKQLAL